MRRIPAICSAGMATILMAAAGTPSARAQGVTGQKLSNTDRAQVEEMLSTIHDAVKKDYYDPTFHGVDMDARYQKYKATLIGAPTLGEAFRVVAAYLSGLRDSRTFFVPPAITSRFDYGFQMQMIGDRSFVTEVRPGSDAATRIHPGDEILKLGSYSVGRKDFQDIEYYLNLLSPQDALEMLLRDPQGATRSELVRTKFITGKRVVDTTSRDGGVGSWDLILQREGMIHLVRQRCVEIGDALIWKIPAFNMNPDEIDTMIAKANKHAALIIDLRGDPGGLIDRLTYLTGSFFDREVTIATPIGRKHDKEVVAKPHGKTFTGRLFVLVDSRSASASELFARTMQLNHRGTVIGDSSAGAVMESKIHSFEAGAGSQSRVEIGSDIMVGGEVVATTTLSPAPTGEDVLVHYAASITNDDLIMSDGKSLEGVGVTPDVIVLPTGADLAVGRDPALSKAAELAGATLDPAAAGKLFPFEWAPLQ
ncbi:MAG TPA: S41 family peptidase [Candidatus Acidoferrales bacterium]|nr:S41 family peptidase [Candidatus Acidoferrales bacterium]